MKQIGKIYRTDVNNIVTNWVALVVILGLIFLPSLYAWFNIKASWDPYGQTVNLKVAVVNHDKGALLRGNSLRIGDDIIASLKNNKKIGWVFTDDKEANRGVNYGQYYASIIIPEDFSERIATVLTDNPQKAEIVYNVNEKINAIAPKIASKGASGIVEQVSSHFIKEANGTIFAIFNKVGLELETQRPTIEEVASLIIKIESILPEINQTVAILAEDMNMADELVQKAQTNLIVIAKAATNYKDFVGQLGKWLDTGSDTLKAIGPNIKNDLILLQETSLAGNELSSILVDTNMNPAVALEALHGTEERFSNAAKTMDKMTELFERLNRIVGENRLTVAVEKMKTMNSILQQQLSLMNHIEGTFSQRESLSPEKMNQFNQLTKDFSLGLENLIQGYDDEIQPHIQQGLGRVKASSEAAFHILEDVSADIPDVQKILKDAEKGLSVSNKELPVIQKRLPVIENKLRDFANLIRTLEEEGTLAEVIDLLKNNASKESEFFAEPVILKENKLYPIPNYGSAMSPFFTTLSLWVGALLLVSLLTVEVHGHEERFKSYEIYFGRYFTFLTLAIMQSLFVTLGDIFLLDTYVVNKFWFIIFGALLSSVFMLIVYTLVSVFGNVGKALAIVLLVLQLAGSGGTFPIQVTGPFFQAIHPLLPFTYGISMMREAVGGIIWEIIIKDLLRLSVYVAFALTVGLSLKKMVNRSTESLVKKVKESKLIH